MYPGFEGSVGPGRGAYGKPHVYARDVHSGAGNCVCGRSSRHQIHPEIAPGFPNPFYIEPGACAPGCDYPVTGYHARRGGKTLCK